MVQVSPISVDLDGKFWYIDPEGGPSIGPFDNWKDADNALRLHLQQLRACPNGGCEE